MVDRGFRRLPTDQRAIVVLHHYLGWSQPEIARALEVPLGTVKSRLFYATRALRAAIEADDRASTAERASAPAASRTWVVVVTTRYSGTGTSGAAKLPWTVPVPGYGRPVLSRWRRPPR